MSKWRPSKLNCLYVIPDIHGADDLLDKVLKRILPLRKSDGGQDKIIFLGDYLDRGKDGHKVLDRLIALKKKYGGAVIFICGNHELMVLEALGYLDCASPSAVYDMWMSNGGLNTLAGYMERAGLSESPIHYPAGRTKDLIPKEHIEFLMHGLDGSYEEDNFVFVHGGCNPDVSPSGYDIQALAWDRTLYKYVMSLIEQELPLTWEKVVICGHSTNGTGKPVIKDKYMMLDCGAPRKLLVVEARSREAFMSLPGKTRLVKFELKETVGAKSKKRPIFRRSAQ